MAPGAVFSDAQAVREIVYIKNRVIAIFPNKEVEVGTMNPGDHLVVREVGGPDGRDWIAFIEAAGPPDAK